MDVNILFRTRANIKGSFTKFRNFINNITDTTTIESIKIRNDKLDMLWEQFVQVDTQLGTAPEQTSEYDQQEDIYLELKERFNFILNKLTVSHSQQPQHSSPTIDDFNVTLNRFAETQRCILEQSHIQDTRLPALNIPQFNGDYCKWPTFKDLFLNSIHNNNSITNSRKFQYLQMYIKGDAEAVIAGMVCSHEAYEEAWQKLCKRFDKQKPIIHEYIKTFFELKAITEPSATTLRTLADKTDCIIHGLRALGSNAEKRDPWLIHILLKKVDNETNQQWAESKEGSCEHPTIEGFLEFLHRRWSALESYQRYKTGSMGSTKSRCSFVAVSQTTPTYNCPMCNEAHRLFTCSNFKALDISARREFVKNNNLCFNCLSADHRVTSCPSQRKCQLCRGSHHSSIHNENLQTNATTNLNTLQTLTATSSFRRDTQQENLLPTAMAIANSPNNNGNFKCKVLLDSGSMATFVSEDLVQRLKLPRVNARVKVTGIGGAGCLYTRGMVSIRLTSTFNNNESIVINAYILRSISHKRQSKVPNLTQFGIDQNLQLADDGSVVMPIDVLIGSEHFFSLLRHGRHTGKQGFPTAQNTIFGYVLSGKVQNDESIVETFSVCIDTDSTIDETLRRFWLDEQPPPTANSQFTPEEQLCENHFKATHAYHHTGRHIVKLPFRQTNLKLGDSLHIAQKQFTALERRLERDTDLRNQYTQFMQEYIELGHMEKVCAPTPGTNYFYLPHHPVLKPQSTSTKCRVVFNGSAKSLSGTSLNDIIAVGPTIQSDLTSLLLNFRSYPIALCCDIVKMYRQILVDSTDRDYQRILWRDAPNKPISHYRLCTVTYGTGSAPFLATRCLYETGKELFPNHIGLLINRNFYVDDFIGGADSLQEAMCIKEQLTTSLSSRGFPLAKWTSNAFELLQPTAPPEEIHFSEFSQPEAVKILGLHWQPSTDSFTFKVIPLANKAFTKRAILSESAKIYDPLGFLAACTVVIKIMFQQLWLHPFGWDDELPSSLLQPWINFRTQYNIFNTLHIPRWLRINSESRFQLCGFADASERAYAAAVYLRVEIDGLIHTHLLTAKTKVAPLKPVSLPRLELSGALLLAKLIRAIQTAMSLQRVEVFAWTDSMIVLAWLSSHPRKWKTYVANRVAEITDITPPSVWSHVHSTENPADFATRGLQPAELISKTLWWKGPDWLSQKQSLWPSCIQSVSTAVPEASTEERKQQLFAFTSNIEPPDVLTLLFEHHSKLSKILNIIAAFNRVIKKRFNRCPDLPAFFTASELDSALLHCIRWSQQQYFKPEIKQLLITGHVSEKSHIAKLTPFVDSNGVLRVGGRIENAHASYRVKHPAIISKHCLLAQRIIWSQHIQNLHAGPTLLLNIIRQRYWIVNCRRLIKQQINKCITCTRQRACTGTQQMAQLPISRVVPSRPFQQTGVDYAGPIITKMHRGRNSKTTKSYIVVFICLTTRAIHLEAVSDMSSEAFLASLKRFISRRGFPSDIYSDNGTNFVGASRELVKTFKQIAQNPQLGSYLAHRKINWHFIPPGAPHFGGSWEAAVKSTKFHFRRVVGTHVLTFEELYTILCEIESQLNSRPITALYDDDTDNIDALTPGHFLIGQALVQLPDHNLQEQKMNRLSRWQLIARIQQDFWRRWQRDYLLSLQTCAKWRFEKQNLSPGAVVLLYDENAPPASWKMGIVTDVHPGSDQLVRVATVKTSTGIVKRPITKLCKLPCEN